MLYENVVPNPDVTWEVANQSNIGFNATTLNKKLTVEADFFYNLRSQDSMAGISNHPESTGIRHFLLKTSGRFQIKDLNML